MSFRAAYGNERVAAFLVLPKNVKPPRIAQQRAGAITTFESYTLQPERRRQGRLHTAVDVIGLASFSSAIPRAYSPSFTHYRHGSLIVVEEVATWDESDFLGSHFWRPW